jgi:hypothetical protein
MWIQEIIKVDIKVDRRAIQPFNTGDTIKIHEFISIQCGMCMESIP